MNEKTLQLLEFDAIRSDVAALSLSEEAGSIILGEKPRLNREEAEHLKSLVEAVHERLVSLGGESRASLPGIAHLFSKLEVEGMVLEADEAYALGIFIERAEAFRQWLLKPLPQKSHTKDLSQRHGGTKGSAEFESCAQNSVSPCLREMNQEANSLPKTILVKAGEPPPLSASERREQEKQRQSIIRRLQRQETEILKALEELENEKVRLEGELARPEVYSSGENTKAIKLKLDENAAALEAKSREWEARAEELEKARKE